MIVVADEHMCSISTTIMDRPWSSERRRLPGGPGRAERAVDLYQTVTFHDMDDLAAVFGVQGAPIMKIAQLVG
jgi:hypothetical protein